ncbi:DUF2334 domain-containing protein [Neobacillus sp. PS3-12]|uniref:DUF2334 domain-containing protein n=1 Tax=Neobacillus sp. PS3-12 TaxID=3070677 RepID=UPI0027E06DA3|nr:DUF2334 domain-containing protein [Neobacillus sp. PS3-12]WML51604.1 DUF2334 domain-containing protein [Neobacillus sp. PS3-12]
MGLKKVVNLYDLLKKNYFQWRYWSNTYRGMKVHLNMELNKEKTTIKTPGIAFSFDDSFRIKHWHTYGKQLFGFYDVKVTFNINAFHHFENQREHSQEEIDMLLELQSDGHEIAHHGYRHKKADSYLEAYGLRKWVEDEIESLFRWMNKQKHSITNERFKKSVSFAFPHFVFNHNNLLVLKQKYYKVVRCHLNNTNLTPFDYSGLAPSICLDGYYGCNLFFLKRILRLVKKSGDNLILTCHSVLPKEVNWQDFGWGKEAEKSGEWRISPKTIQKIIFEARKLGLEFYTTSEIAGVATFIDQNFEKCIRDELNIASSEWLSISELSSMNKLDLSNKEISNIDGIQYFTNLKEIDLSNNKISDLRLLGKLKNLNRVNVENNPVKVR